MDDAGAQRKHLQPPIVPAEQGADSAVDPVDLVPTDAASDGAVDPMVLNATDGDGGMAGSVDDSLDPLRSSSGSHF